ncbi:MAG TPA: tripartite tricarboxylate transporter permease, partial [Hyphomicrobiales bacterium]|nr:tripartite tricarboxylate transporter permease [Hyphomicrobiales bacterium]
VGLFAVSEAFMFIEAESILTSRGRQLMKTATWGATLEGVTMTFKRWWHVTWTAVIGLVIGVIPGAGASIASFVAYQQSKVFSKTPELYGTGHPEGLIAPESANNGVTSGTLIPLLVLGIPGGATAAIMIVVLQFHGVQMGPRLFMAQPELAYGMLMSMFVTYLIMIFTILPLSRYMSKVTMVSTVYMAPLVIAFTLVGSFVPREYMFDMYVGLAFGVIGYVARKTGYHVAAILIGVILGPMLEMFFLRALRIAQGDLMVLFSSTIGNVLWVLLVITIALPYFMDWRRKRRGTPEEDLEEKTTPALTEGA